MKRSIFTFLAIACTTLVIAFFTSTLDLTLGRLDLLPLQPTLLAFISVGLLATREVILALRSTSRSVMLTNSLKNLAIPIISYLLMAICALIFSALAGAHWREAGRWVLLLPYGFLIWFSALIISAQEPLKGAAFQGLRLGFFLLCGSILYEIFSPGSFSNLFGRASGFAGNANFAALAVCMLLAGILDYGFQRTRLYDIRILLVGSIAVIATQSRSGLFEFAIVVFVWACSFFWRPVVSVRAALRAGFRGLLVIAVVAIALWQVLPQSALFSSEGSRFARMLAGKSIDDGAGDERVQVAMEALDLVAEAPIVGHGTGYVRKMRVPPHNQYLQQWVNNGVFGLLAYVVLLLGTGISAAKHRYFPGVAFACVALAGSFFSHNILDQRTFIFALAILLTRIHDTKRTQRASAH